MLTVFFFFFFSLSAKLNSVNKVWELLLLLLLFFLKINQIVLSDQEFNFFSLFFV